MSKFDDIEQELPEYLETRKMFLMDQDSIGQIEDICGQLNDVEGEHQKLAEECIERLIKLIKPYENMKIKKEIWNEDYGFWETVEKQSAIAELERDHKEGNL